MEIPRGPEPHAEPGDDHLDARGGLVDLTGHHQLQPGLGKQPLSQRALPYPRPGGDNGFAREVGHGHLPPAGEPVPERHGEQDFLAEQHVMAQPRPVKHLGGQAEVDLSLAQPLGHDLRCRLKKTHGDTWMLGDEALDRFGDREQRLRGERDAAAGETGGVGEFASGVVQLGQGPVHPAQECGAELVEADPPAVPVEQRHAHVGLQPRDGPAERGLGDAELLSRPAHVLVARHGLEIAQRQQIHYASTAMNIWKN